MNFKDLFLEQHEKDILNAKTNILSLIDNKLQDLNNYIIGKVDSNEDYSDIETAKKHYENIISLRKLVNVEDELFIKLDIDEVIKRAKEERIKIVKFSIFYNNYSFTIDASKIYSGSISANKLSAGVLSC